MIINHNMQSINANRQMGVNQANAQKSMEKLSSGLRINRAGDDAAGLTISEKMRGQIRGLDQAGRNAQDGISLIQTAEGALTETHSILQRMRELSVQSANDTNTDNDRSEIQKEINQLIDEIDRISHDTEFNNKTLLDGKLAEKTTTGAEVKTRTAGALEGTPASATVEQNENNTGKAKVEITDGGASYNGAEDATFTITKTADGWTVAKGGDSATVLDVEGNKAEIEGIKITIDEVTEGAANEGDKFTITAKAAVAGETTPPTTPPTGEVTTGDNWKDKDGNIITTKPSVDTSKYNGVNGDVTFEVKADKDGKKYLEASQNGKVIGKAEAEGTTRATANYKFNGAVISADLDTVAVGSKFSIKFAGSDETGVAGGNGPLKFQVGANSTQNIPVSINDMGSDKLGTLAEDGTLTSIASLKVEDGKVGGVLTQEDADEAITVINNAINQVSAERSKLGAVQNRLEHTINNLGTSSENLTAAESRIRDVDMAKEMMEMSKHNILQQASQAMLAQANQAPQQVLQLLR